MGSDGNLKTWVSDKLMSLLGYSQSTIVQYVIGLSKQANSPADVVSKLVEFGLSSSSETRGFAEEIFNRVPRKASGLNLYQKQEREAAMIARKKYALLDADDEDDDDNHGANGGIVSVDSSTENKRAASRGKRFRKRTDDQDEDDEAEFHI
ncbi:PWI domain containing protein [Trema orientale]|uniref:PWI domain containing protein n=1 Tax=Trema orientale TaxID=63057 RepID=A0A2P5DAL6_TREOI|nr:PWI domain containing protein [Trema orientale]